MSLPEDEAWFPAKRYGYGWGLPIRWQGWVVSVLYFGVVIAAGVAFARTRPEIVPHLIETTSESFPSGHAASAASIYLLLAAMLAPSLPTSAARRYVFAAAIVMALLVGASRVVLGVHYPSDVLAGWSFGVGWTMTALLIADRIRSR